MKTSNIYAFFDIDGTLINFNSLLSFLDYMFRAYYGKSEGARRLKVYQQLVSKIASPKREQLNKLYYSNFRGMKQSLIARISEEWFNTTFADSGVFNEKCVIKLRQHQSDGHCIVIVSGGFFGTINPLARYLNIEHVLCVQPLITQGRLTGEIDPAHQTIGRGKAIAIRNFMQLASRSKDSLSSCYAYGDHISDVAMLAMVGNPVVVGADAALLEQAKLSQWQCL